MIGTVTHTYREAREGGASLVTRVEPGEGEVKGSRTTITRQIGCEVALIRLTLPLTRVPKQRII